MNVLEKIHERWAADAALESLLAAASVYTGQAIKDSLPYATIQKTAGVIFARPNDGSKLHRLTIRVAVFHETHAAGAAISDAVFDAFDNCAFDLDGGDAVFCMRQSGDAEGQNPDGAWVFERTFEVLVREAP